MDYRIAFLPIFFAFGILYWVVGLWASRRVRTQGDYFLAGRSLGIFSLTGTLIATQLGGGMILGTAEHAYRIGVPGIFYSLGMCCGFLLLGVGFAAMLRSFEVATTAELFEQQYKSRSLRAVASFLSILSLIGLFIGQVVASKALLSTLGITGNIPMMVLWGGLVWYTMHGGLPAVVATDLLQVVLIVAVFAGIFGHMLWTGAVDFSLFSAVFTRPDAAVSSTFSSHYWIGYIIMPMLFSLVEQDLAQRFFAAKSRGVAMAGALIASICIFLFAFIPVYFGILARTSEVVIPAGSNPLLAVLLTKVGPMIYSCVLCALFAAIASTADSLLCAISSNVVQDMVPDSVLESRRMQLSRLATAVTGAVGIGGAYLFADILPILTQSYELLVSSILVSVLMCFTSVPRKSQAAMASVGAGFSAFFIFRVLAPPFGVPREIASILISLAGYIGGYLGAQPKRAVQRGK